MLDPWLLSYVLTFSSWMVLMPLLTGISGIAVMREIIERHHVGVHYKPEKSSFGWLHYAQ